MRKRGENRWMMDGSSNYTGSETSGPSLPHLTNTEATAPRLPCTSWAIRRMPKNVSTIPTSTHGTPCRRTDQAFWPHSWGKSQETCRLTGTNTIPPTDEAAEKCRRFWRSFQTWYLARMMWNRHLTKRNSRKRLMDFWIICHQRKEAFSSDDTGTPTAFRKLLPGTI